jgi:serine/threonine protein kinase
MKAMREIHAVHRDIKNANILLHFEDSDDMDSSRSDSDDLPPNVKVKLADFGFAVII